MADATRPWRQRLSGDSVAARAPAGHTWPHERAHPDCEHRNWTACDRAWTERLGRCAGKTADKKAPQPCIRWAVELVGQEPASAFCVQHAHAEAERRKAESASAHLLARIDAFIEARRVSPSVWG